MKTRPPNFCLELFDLLVEHRRSAHQPALHRRRVVLVGARVIHHVDVHGRHTGHGLDLVLLDQFEAFLWIEPAHQDRLAGVQVASDRNAEAEAVRERQHQQTRQPEVFADLRVVAIVGIGKKVGVSLHHALRVSGRAAGVEDHREIRAVALDRLGHRLAVGKQAVETQCALGHAVRVPRHDHVPHVAAARASLPSLFHGAPAR